MPDVAVPSTYAGSLPGSPDSTIDFSIMSTPAGDDGYFRFAADGPDTLLGAASINTFRTFDASNLSSYSVFSAVDFEILTFSGAQIQHNISYCFYHT